MCMHMLVQIYISPRAIIRLCNKCLKMSKKRDCWYNLEISATAVASWVSVSYPTASIISTNNVKQKTVMVTCYVCVGVQRMQHHNNAVIFNKYHALIPLQLTLF